MSWSYHSFIYASNMEHFTSASSKRKKVVISHISEPLLLFSQVYFFIFRLYIFLLWLLKMFADFWAKLAFRDWTVTGMLLISIRVLCCNCMWGSWGILSSVTCAIYVWDRSSVTCNIPVYYPWDDWWTAECWLLTGISSTEMRMKDGGSYWTG